MTLAGRSLFVTGGNSGIGLATALRFAREGADIAIFSRRAEANANAADTLHQLDTDGKKQGWWQVEGPLPDRPDYTAGQLFEEGRYTDNRRIGTWRR